MTSHVIEEFATSEKKTKEVAKILSNIKPTGKVLLVDDTFADDFAIASRNIARAYFCESATLNALNVVEFDNIIVSRKGLDTVLARLNKDER